MSHRSTTSSSWLSPPPRERLGVYEKSLRVVAFATPSSCGLYRCWMQWMANIASADQSMAYDFNVRVQPHGNFTQSSGAERERLYLMGVKGKIAYVKQVLHERSQIAGDGEWILFTDLDVVPLRPLSMLPPLQTNASASGNANTTIWFMNERHEHGGKLGSWTVNSGFYLLRNTLEARRFVKYWHVMLCRNRKLKDQDAANFLLNKQMTRSEIAWDTFDESMVTGNVERVDARTIAYHAIHAQWAADKAVKLREAFARARAARGGVELQQTPCDPLAACPGGS